MLALFFRLPYQVRPVWLGGGLAPGGRCDAARAPRLCCRGHPRGTAGCPRPASRSDAATRPTALPRNTRPTAGIYPKFLLRFV